MPGGLDDIALNALTAEESKGATKGLRTVAPGLTRGLRLPGDDVADDLANLDAHQDDLKDEEEVLTYCASHADYFELNYPTLARSRGRRWTFASSYNRKALGHRRFVTNIR